MSNNYLFVGNDNYIEVDALSDGASGALINDATVSVTLKDSAGVDVLGQAWPLTLNYVAASNGRYAGILQDTLALVKNAQYQAVIDVDGGGYQAHWERWYRAIERR